MLKNTVNFYFKKAFSTKKNALFFIPEALFEIHYVTMNYLADTYNKLGHKSIITKCYDEYQFCPPYLWLPKNFSDKQRIEQCKNCLKFAKEAEKIYNFEFVDLNGVIDLKNRENYSREIENYIGDLLSFKYNNIAFGKLTSYQFVLITRVSDFQNLNFEQIQTWKKLIHTAITSYFQVKSLIERKKISFLVFYNFYATEVGAVVAAKESNINFFYVSNISHRWVDRKSVYISKPNEYYLLTENWKKWRNFALSESELEECFEDLLINYFSIGSHRYSPKKEITENIFDLREKLRIPKDKKILSAFTSSDDERLGLSLMFNEMGFDSLVEKKDCFKDQIEWLKTLINWVESREEFYLIVRIHPRSGKNNQGDSSNTQFYIDFLEKIDKIYNNVLIIHPHDQISSYDIIDISNVCLVSWSSIGLDIARLGGKCLSSLKLIPTFPDDVFVYYEKDLNSYFNKIIELSEIDLNIESIIYAYRWYYYSRFSLSYQFKKISAKKEFTGFPRANEPLENILKLNKIFNGKNIKEINFEERNKKSKNNKSSEIKTLIKLLLVYLHLTFTKEDNSEIKIDYTEIDINNFSINNQNLLSYNYKNIKYSRYSLLGNNILKWLRKNID